MLSISITSNKRQESILITHLVEQAIHEAGFQEGAVLLFCPHTTATLTLNEAADPDVMRDIHSFMHELVPQSPLFRHKEGNSDAHIKSSLFSAHCMCPVTRGQLQLGRWQGIYFCEWDGPRNRSLYLQFLAAAE